MELKIEKTKSRIELKVESELMIERIKMNELEFQLFTLELEEVAKDIWKDKFKPQEVTGMGNDYYEYYDRKYDNNGYLSLTENNGIYTIKIERPCLESNHFYILNKVKAQTFVNDCFKLIKRNKI